MDSSYRANLVKIVQNKAVSASAHKKCRNAMGNCLPEIIFSYERIFLFVCLFQY